MKSFFTLFFGLAFLSSFSQFVGSIEFKYYTAKDTTLNTYWVKDKKIKLDQYAKRGNAIEGSFIFDLGEKTIKFVNPKRKVWGDQKSEIPPVMKGKCDVKKSKASKVLNGVKCTEYIVKNTEENTVITYWIVTSKYDFFAPLVKAWNRKDKQSIYFNQIKDLPKGSMPLLSEEKSLDGALISKLEVSKINKSTIDASKLSIPADYKKFEQK